MNKTSDIWKYFKKTDKIRVKCQLCNHSLSYASGTSNMWRHVRNKHILQEP